MNTNIVIIAGRLTRDIELRYTQSGTAVCEVSLANSRKFKDKEETVFAECTLWGRTAEVAAEYLRKGSPALIEGRLSFDQWEDRETGKKRSKLKVTGERLQLVPTGQKQSQPAQQPQQEAPSFASDADADVPF